MTTIDLAATNSNASGAKAVDRMLAPVRAWLERRTAGRRHLAAQAALQDRLGRLSEAGLDDIGLEKFVRRQIWLDRGRGIPPTGQTEFDYCCRHDIAEIASSRGMRFPARPAVSLDKGS